jgi:hypothetical protein
VVAIFAIPTSLPFQKTLNSTLPMRPARGFQADFIVARLVVG